MKQHNEQILNMATLGINRSVIDDSSSDVIATDVGISVDTDKYV